MLLMVLNKYFTGIVIAVNWLVISAIVPVATTGATTAIVSIASVGYSISRSIGGLVSWIVGAIVVISNGASITIPAIETVTKGIRIGRFKSLSIRRSRSGTSGFIRRSSQGNSGDRKENENLRENIEFVSLLILANFKKN